MRIKNLFVVRHAHSGFNAETDFQRDLNEKGKEAALSTAGFIKNISDRMDLKIELCLCSAAHRTVQTAEIICSQLSSCELVKDAELYATVTGKWMDRIEASAAKNMIVVGHNPTMSQLLSILGGKSFFMNPAECGWVEVEIYQDGIKSPGRLMDFSAK